MTSLKSSRFCCGDEKVAYSLCYKMVSNSSWVHFLWESAGPISKLIILVH